MPTSGFAYRLHVLRADQLVIWAALKSQFGTGVSKFCTDEAIPRDNGRYCGLQFLTTPRFGSGDWPPAAPHEIHDQNNQEDNQEHVK
jgi:hypothetical protein